MRVRIAALCACLALAACAGAPAVIVPRAADMAAITPSDFSLLGFLEGRWQGRAPDGVPFWEEFRFVGPLELEVRRFADTSFEDPVTVGRFEVVNGRLVYRAGHHRWMATELTARSALFEPVLDAPTHVAWRLEAPDRLRVVHAWTSAARQHALTVELARLATEPGATRGTDGGAATAEPRAQR